MFTLKRILRIFLILVFMGNVFAASVILNEYNAVDAAEFLNGGNASADAGGGRASDSYFGRVQGNGGDWFELVVITNHLDMRGWKFDIYENSVLDETLDLTSHSIWSDLQSGTIMTVSEDLPSDISYNPAAGDWWINVQAKTGGDGLYIEATSFPVGSSNWQLRIRNAAGSTIFGPAGEGVSPTSGVGGTEIFRLEANPSASILANSADYDDGDDFSTFGSLNQWGRQNVSALRIVAPGASTLTLLSPNGSEVIMGGTDYDVTWSSTGTIGKVIVEFSLDNGISWSEVYPPNTGNTGSYVWLVPMVDSEECRVRVTNAGNLAVYDSSLLPFTVYQCVLTGDLTGDCRIDLNDLAVMAASWLGCANPYDPTCQ